MKLPPSAIETRSKPKFKMASAAVFNFTNKGRILGSCDGRMINTLTARSIGNGELRLLPNPNPSTDCVVTVDYVYDANRYAN